MIIQVCGMLVNTEFIYHISDVRCDFRELGQYYGADYSVIGFFTICFVNSNSIDIVLSGKDCHKTMHTEGYKKEEAEVSEKLNAVRNHLISYWNKNNSLIPKIDFDETENQHTPTS